MAEVITAIDPGPTESAFCVINAVRRPIWFDKVPNDVLLMQLRSGAERGPVDQYAIEMIAAYGMPVGADVFDTCVWIGRFQEAISHVTGSDALLIKRNPVKVHHCHSSKAKDSNIRQALVDRFAKGQRNHGKGTKDAPGWFHGFHRDVWQAYALAVYVADTQTL